MIDVKIKPMNAKSIFNSLVNKIILLGLILFSLKMIAFGGQPHSDIKINLNKTEKISGEVVISGAVKSEEGKPLANTKIIFDSTEVALTDKDGKFSFNPGKISPSGHNIYFYCDSFVTVIRTYYPVMLSVSFDIVLRRQFGGDGQERIKPFHIALKDSAVTKKTIEPTKIIAAPIVTLDLPSILFKENETELGNQNRTFLDFIAKKLNDNPSVKIDIKAYTPESNPNSTIAQTRLTNIIKYLTEKKGISATRLNKVTEPGGGDENVIDLVNSQEQ